jgi:transposase
MTTFIYNDGCGNMQDEARKDIIQMDMDVDDVMYPIQSVINYSEYLDVKPPEPLKITKTGKEEDNESVKDDVPKKKSSCVSNKHYKDTEKEQLFYLVYEKWMTVRAAALQLQIKPRTAQHWVQKDQEDPQDEIQRKAGNGRPRGKPAILGEEHKQSLVDKIDENLSLVLYQMMASLTEQFAGLDIGKTALYNFVTTKCRISLKRTHFYSVERNCSEKIGEIPMGEEMDGNRYRLC